MRGPKVPKKPKKRTFDFGGAFFGLHANLTVFSKLILSYDLVIYFGLIMDDPLSCLRGNTRMELLALRFRITIPFPDRIDVPSVLGFLDVAGLLPDRLLAQINFGSVSLSTLSSSTLPDITTMRTWQYDDRARGATNKWRVLSADGGDPRDYAVFSNQQLTSSALIRQYPVYLYLLVLNSFSNMTQIQQPT